ncbi:heavy-metal-associated domain-containing protein [Roseovarius pelagicus]|uniref:Heavy-metal-associated domain-containing protein n=1 Tax=Roseovarius pelagicus TaxID=2980108 RepID=A0ABY6DHR8_9RHOB|nr:heavy-metal-associated domain-containing protein [Roseovarius pelagicus]UXX85374.1 heavy-metal-associated domain-containing protein [Roseovarius pelagicus]
MIRFSVPNMSCGHCTASIQKAIMAADPDAKVSCDLTERIVDVDSTLDESELAATISGAGYGAEKLSEVQ